MLGNRCLKCSGFIFIEQTYTHRKNITCWRCFNCGKYIEVPGCDVAQKTTQRWFFASDQERRRLKTLDRTVPGLKRVKASMTRVTPLIRLIKSLEIWIEKDPSEHLKVLLKNAQDNLNRLRES